MRTRSATEGWQYLVYFLLAVCFLNALWNAWGERKFVAEFGAWFIATAVHMAMLAAVIAGGSAIGIQVARTTRRDWCGWLSGLAAAFAICIVLQAGIARLPGLAWRIDALSASGDE